jgi:hypothetical protein
LTADSALARLGVDRRTATVSTGIGWLQEGHHWPGLAAIGKVVRIRETPGKTTTETAYYPISTALSSERFNQVVRFHWGVENCLRWRLDVVMNEEPADWTRSILRDSTRGELRVDIAHRRVRLWDGEEATARCWHLMVRREVGSPKTIKCTVSNAPADTPLLRLAQMQGQRYWVERTFEDAKGECGLADYQVLGWRAWHHHVTMVMLAMLFIAEQRAAHQPGLELLAPRDIVEMLKDTLPRKPEGREALVARINRRHERRRGAIESRYRTQQKAVPPWGKQRARKCDSVKLILGKIFVVSPGA